MVVPSVGAEVGRDVPFVVGVPSEDVGIVVPSVGAVVVASVGTEVDLEHSS